jgi:tetratricopeptide (TPR) repeat protein
VARRIVTLVGRRGNDLAPESIDDVEVDSSLLSLFCSELNELRLSAGLLEITADLVERGHLDILRSFYESALKDQPEAVREFIVDQLLTDSGARDNIDRERANVLLARKGVPAGVIDELVRRRLLHIDERSGRPRVELIHDVLLDVVREDKTKRQAIRESEANLLREREAAQEAVRVSEANRLREREAARRRIRRLGIAFAVAIGIGLITFAGYSEYARRVQRDLANQNFQLAVTSAQKLLGQVDDSLNRGLITVKGAYDMLQVARGIVEQVNEVERTPQTAELLVKLGWTASDIYATLGNLTQAYDSAKGARDLVEPLYRADPGNPKLVALMLDSTWRMGDAISSRDMVRTTQEQALKVYQEAEWLARQLVQMAPEDGTQQRNLVFVLQKVGDVYQGLGDWEAAIRTYREALPIMQAVAAKAPQNRDWQRDLANTLSRLGQALAGKGDLDAALEQFRAALKIRTTCWRPIASTPCCSPTWRPVIAK